MAFLSDAPILKADSPPIEGAEPIGGPCMLPAPKVACPTEPNAGWLLAPKENPVAGAAFPPGKLKDGAP